MKSPQRQERRQVSLRWAAAAFSIGCAAHQAPAAPNGPPIENFRAVRIMEVYPSGKSQPTWTIEVPRQFVEDILGTPAIQQCMDALQDPQYDGCSFVASPCMSLYVREDGGYRAHVRSWSCRIEAPSPQVFVIYNSGPNGTTPPQTIPILVLPSQEQPEGGH